jgi:hypothetical protein
MFLSERQAGAGVAMKSIPRFLLLALALVSSLPMRPAEQGFAAEESPAENSGPAYGPQLEGFAYPWPVVLYRFRSQRQDLEMAYMDVEPARPNGRVAVLLHGKNFCAATWQATITTLVDAGYRVIAPDQIGFCNRLSRRSTSSAFSNSRTTLMRCSNRSGYVARR